jgi:hypothetical protein
MLREGSPREEPGSPDDSSHKLPGVQDSKIHRPIPAKAISTPLKGEIDVVGAEGQEQKTKQARA